MLALTLALKLKLPVFSDFPSDQDILLFSIHGSNTIGATLAPSLVKAYLEKKGADSVEVIPAGNNEHWVQGRISASGTFVKVYLSAHGSGTGF